MDSNPCSFDQVGQQRGSVRQTDKPKKSPRRKCAVCFGQERRNIGFREKVEDIG